MHSFKQQCVWTPTMTLSKADIVSLEVLLRALIPYVIPAIVFPYPLLILYKTSQDIVGTKLKMQIRIIINIVSVYMLVNLPYSITFLIHYTMMWQALNQVKRISFLKMCDTYSDNFKFGQKYKRITKTMQLWNISLPWASVL